MNATVSSPSPLYTPLAHQGGMAFSVTNVLINDWIASWDGRHPLLDIGCGNCNNSRKALETGATVFAAEMDTAAIEQHKRTFKGNEQISFHYLKLPQEVPFQDNSFSGILCSEVFHFLTHADVVATVWEFHRILAPGGKAIVTCASELIKAFQVGGIQEQQEKQRIHSPLKLGLIPDYIRFLRNILEKSSPTQLAQEIYDLMKQKTLPTTYFSCFNPQQLAMVFSRLGFEIEHLDTGPADHYPLWEHGKDDQVRLIAVKK
ncbi:class I SAM-dependent methyltransferase [Sansalvadorimonas sp. 2012CJ34-2]|uniref:Class I SAM-dependent methyltransferase n=1 Tax=Parendozoicomonas callyspongiae TaxID=2942213 RepID=A0ABT0PHK5_9GAMM|nr:class I SAM-dependent methyltransferase [Sansalvadorimonas sp. 2012CJ34-2]MCL6270858.1 class I SAM-dependent methyltransferase [Sansalvadorimonas sp. 2012CJ34-2]